MPGIPKESFNEIIENSFGRTIESYKARNRKAEIVKQKQIIMLYYRKCKKMKFLEIAKEFGLDHSSVIYSVNVITSQIKHKDYQEQLNKLPLHIKRKLENES